MSKLDTNHVVNLDLVKDRVNSVIKFGLADVETSDFYLGLYNNGSRVFDKHYIVTLYIVKPNGTFRNIELESKEGLKKYYCNLPDTLKNIPGEYVCQAVIFDNLAGEKKISKSKFKYSVDLDLASEMAGIIDEEEQESILTNVLNRLLTLENPVEPYATQKHVDECVSTLTEEIDTIKVKDTEQDGRLVNIESKNTEQDGRLNAVETKNNEQDNRLDIIEAKDIEQDNRLVNIESKNTEQDNRLNTIESKNIEQDGRLNTLENKVDGIDEKIVDTIEPTLVNHGNRVDALESKDLVHESRMTDIESKNVEQDNRLTSIEGINTTQDNRLNALESKDITHESRMANIETKNTEQDGRLDVAENRLANIGNDITNTMQPIIDEHTSRLDAIEAIDVAQNNRLDAIESKNTEQDDRLLNIEKANKRQDNDLKCLFAASKNNMIDVTEEGNSVYLQNSTIGYTSIDEIKGNTLVNCNKEPDKELILNGNINTSGDNAVTLTEGVDGGLVDVALEGNTLVNVSKTKDSTAITMACIVENSGNHVALQGDADGNCRPVITGNTLWIDNATGEVLTAFDETKNLRLQSSFEDNLVTQEMVDSGEEVADNLGKYRVDYKSTREDGTAGSTKTLYLNSPLLEGDTIEEKDGGIYHVHRFKKLIFNGSEGWNTIAGQSSSDNNTYLYQKTDSQIMASSNSDTLSLFCDKLRTEPAGNNWLINSSYNNTISLNVKSAISVRTSLSTVGELKTWLQANNLKVVAKLATPQYELIEQSNLAIPSYANGHLDLTSAVPVEKVDFLPFSEELTYLYANTQYTLQFVSDRATTADINLGGTELLAQNIVKGLNRISITTPSTLVDNKLIISGVGAKISEVVVTNTDREFMYFEGMKSVGEGNGIEILSHNGNLYKRLENSYYKIYGSGVIVVEDNEDSFIFEVNDWDKGISYLISTEGLFKNKKYKLTWEKYNELAIPQLHASGITLLNSNKRVKEQVSFEKISNVDWNFELPDSFEQGDILEIRFKSSIASGQNGACNICINEVEVTKNTALSKLNKQQLTHEPLRAVGDVKDRYVLIDGKWYIERNCKEVTFDENIALNIPENQQNKGFTRFYSNTNAPNKKSNSHVKCDKMITSDVDYLTGVNFECISGFSNNIYLNFQFRGDNLTIQDIKNRLREEPITMVYELASPVYEPINYNPLVTYSDITHITTNSAIPTNITVKNHGFNCLLKPNTTYTISSNLGLNTVTTPSTLTEDCLRFMDTDTSDVTTMKDVLVLEGDWTTKADLIPSNFSGIESAFEQEYDIEKGKYKVNVKVTNEDKTQENNIIFYINEPLRGVGDAKDRIYVKDDKVVVERNCGSVTFDGSDDEDWYIQDVNYQLTLAGEKRICLKQTGLAICDKMVVSPSLSNKRMSIFTIFEGGIDYIRFPNGVNIWGTKQEFIQWLQQNPVTLIYPTSQVTYEEVEYNDTKLFIESFKNSTLSYNSNVAVTSTVHYSYSVPIVDTVAQTASISDEQDQLIINLATQVAVLEMMTM